MSAPQQILLSGAGTGDPNFGSVVLLLHCDGTNGSTSFPDNSIVGNSMTAVGNAQVSTAVFKYGTGSAAFDGTGDAITTPGLNGQQLFPTSGQINTTEFWLNLTALPGVRSTIFGKWISTTGGLGWTVDVTSSGDLFFTNNGAGTSCTLSTKITTGSWLFLATVNTGSILNVYLNGNLVGSQANYTPSAATSAYYIGERSDSALPMNGYIDEFRVTQGVARYTANFTPPTGPFPNF